MKKERIKNMVHLKNRTLKEIGDYLRKYGKDAKVDSLFSYWKLLLRSKLIPPPPDVRIEWHHGIGKKLSELRGEPVDNSPDNLFSLIEDSNYLSGCYEHGNAHKYLAHSKILVEHFGKDICQQAFITPYSIRWRFLEEDKNYFIENNCMIPVIAYCIETRKIKEYSSILSASTDLEIHQGSLTHAFHGDDREYCISKKDHSHYGFFPKSANEDPHSIIENYEKKIKKIKFLSNLLKVRDLVESDRGEKITRSSNKNLYQYCRNHQDNINVKKLFEMGIIQISKNRNCATTSKEVIIFCPDTYKIIDKFNSATDAAKIYQISASSISENCHGKSSYFRDKTGFEIKFKEDFEELIKQRKTEP